MIDQRRPVHPQKMIGLFASILLYVIMPFMMLPGAQETYHAPKLLAGAAIAAGWILALFVLRMLDAERVRRFGPGSARMTYWNAGWIDALPIVLLGFSMVSMWYSVDRAQSLLGFSWVPEGLFSWLLYMILFLLFRHEGSWSESVMNTGLIAASLIALIGILQFGEWLPLFSDGYLSIGMATIGNRNFVGTYTTLMLPISVWMWMEKAKWPYLLSSVLLFLLMLASLTRSAWIAFLVWFPLLLLLELRKKEGVKRLLLFFGVIVLAFVLADVVSGNLFSKRIGSILNDLMHLSSDDAGSSRMLIWKMSLPLLFDRPVTGYGIDTFNLVFFSLPGATLHFDRLERLMKAHNEWLQIGITMGWGALLSYLVLLFGAIGKGISSIWGKLRAHPWKVPVLCAVVGYVVQAQFNISVPLNALLFWALLGLLASDQRQDGDVASGVME